MLRINDRIAISEDEIEIRGVRSQGPGGQNVNKVSSAVHLRFDIRGSSLPQHYKERLLSLADKRITKDGIINIKAQQSRSREKNREMAYGRLRELIHRAGLARKKRRATKPTCGSRQRRLESKTRRGKVKLLRRNVIERD